MQFHGTTRILRLLSVKIMTMTTTKKTLTCALVTSDDELDDTAYTVGTPTDDPERLEQSDVNLEDADASASQVYASARRSFQEARELLARVKSARGYFPVVGIGAFDGLAQPSTDRKPITSRGKGKKGERKGNPPLRKVENRQVWVYRAFCQEHRVHVSSLVLRCPRIILTEAGATVEDHFTLLVFVLISACCVDKWDIVLQNVPTKGNRLLSHLENMHLVPVLWIVQCSIPVLWCNCRRN